MKKAFKIGFSLVFLFFTILWIVFAIETLYPDKLNIFADWTWFQDNIHTPIINEYTKNGNNGWIGYNLIVYSGAVFLAYNSVIYTIQKIPLIGSVIKSLTFFISLISFVAIIIGSLMLTGIIG